ncbi:MAG: response regulator transcription factor [Candidatus Levybacteria bacterium]|nr:response regulator transcription factor [Candidatus Levybacteria bacterium]
MRILVVEDEHKIANSIKQGLEQEHYAVDVSYNGKDGYDLAMGEDYDLIILDLLLPGIQGGEICKKLRSSGNNTPILMLTAKGQIADKVKGLNTGADDYMVKPFAFEELLARIRAVSRRPRSVLNRTLKVNDLTLNTTTFEVNRFGKIINLSGKEYALLEYFMRHPDKILTKEQIINHVWNYDANILPNTVEVYVGYLRNKINKPFGKLKPLIRTIRGFGYKIGDKK